MAISTETIALIAIGVTLAGQTITMVLSIRKNGKALEPHIVSHTAPLKVSIDNVADILKNPDTGLVALNEKVNKMKENCIKTTTHINDQLDNLESGIANAEIQDEKIHRRIDKLKESPSH